MITITINPATAVILARHRALDTFDPSMEPETFHVLAVYRGHLDNLKPEA